MRKRDLFKKVGTASVFGAMALPAGRALAAAEGAASRYPEINVRDFGAKGDGKTPDSAAIQKAIDAAGEICATVYFPAGKYLCSELKLRPNTTLLGDPQWAYRGVSGAVLQLDKPDAKCVVDISRAYGAHIRGLCLYCGEGFGAGACGILLNHAEGYSKKEDSVVVEDCKITGFGADALRLCKVWLFIVRRNIFIGNKGAGVALTGWDGFVSDNQFSGNGGGGFVCREVGATVMFTANRVEWNKRSGLEIGRGDAWNVTGNCFDHNWGPGLSARDVSDMAVCSNVFRRNGRIDAEHGADSSCHVRLENCKGITVTGNSGASGRDDGGTGNLSPRDAFVVSGCSCGMVTANAFYKGAMDACVRNLGGCSEDFLIDGNAFTRAVE